MKVILDSQHELLLLDGGTMKIFRTIDGERHTVALGREAKRRMILALTDSRDIYDVGNVLRITGKGTRSQSNISFQTPAGEPDEIIDLTGKEVVIVENDDRTGVVTAILREDEHKRPFTMPIDPDNVEWA